MQRCVVRRSPKPTTSLCDVDRPRPVILGAMSAFERDANGAPVQAGAERPAVAADAETVT
jgi:hypothetical protein